MPDLLIIKFDDKIDTLRITKLPRYPIYLGNTFYITPICIQQINGFPNDTNDQYFLINEFIKRILIIFGAILS